MKVVTWNCNGALRLKLQPLAELDADLYVVQECEDPARSGSIDYQDWAANHLWTGPTKNRGIGIFAKANITLEPVDLDAGALELFLPCIVDRSMALLGAWTRQANSPTFGYIGQLWKWLQLHRDFLRHDAAAVIGDLNSNVRWDKWDRWWNHSDVVRELQDLGLESAYHDIRGERQGGESTPTYYRNRKDAATYHIDYVFLSRTLLHGATVEVGSPSDWLNVSDHLPIVTNIPGMTDA